MYYLKLFDEHSGYTEYIENNEFEPNVSHCIEENHVHYDPSIEGIGIVGFSWTLGSATMTLKERLPQGATNVTLMKKPYYYGTPEWSEISATPSTNDNIVWTFTPNGYDFSPGVFNCCYVRVKYTVDGDTHYTSVYDCDCDR